MSSTPIRKRRFRCTKMPVICVLSNTTCSEHYSSSSTSSSIDDQRRLANENAAAQSEIILWRKLAIGFLVGCVVVTLLAAIAWFHIRRTSKRRARMQKKTKGIVPTTKSSELSKLMPYGGSKPHLSTISESPAPCYSYAVQSNRDNPSSPVSTPGWLTSPLTLPELPARDQVEAGNSPSYPTPIMTSPYSPTVSSPQFSRCSCYTVFEEHMAPGPHRVISQKDRTSMHSSSAVVLGRNRK
ncbi:hypothetical protein DE146DRAFT_459573 [Phaeosphaeria sp. MPI-PUGE-AT-0046c]|nr:hypothetical protein DE146DRAFT_459573 [Phaeosphaeria sp. MPI-PUGE-AT-0046c]